MPPTSDFQLSSGDYPNLRYWSIERKDHWLAIWPGRIPWGTLLLLQILVGGPGFLLLAFAYSKVPNEPMLLTMMGIPVGMAVIGCLVLPILKVRSERALGDILIYRDDQELLELPRQRLVVRKEQVVEFRILQETSKPLARRSWKDRVLRGRQVGNACPAAELEVVLRNTPTRRVSLLKMCGTHLFGDVVRALKTAGFPRIVRIEQQANRSDWVTQEL